MSGVPVTRARDDGRLVSVHNVYLGPWAAAHWAAPPDTYQHVRWHMGTVPPPPLPSAYAGFYPNIFIAEMLGLWLTDIYLMRGKLHKGYNATMQLHNATLLLPSGTFGIQSMHMLSNWIHHNFMMPNNAILFWCWYFATNEFMMLSTNVVRQKQDISNGIH